MDTIIPNIEKMKELNGNKFAASDYVNFILNVSESSSDVARSFSDIFFPTFKVVDGLPFNESFGSHERFLDYIEKGIVQEQAYYWSHVIDIEGLLNIDRDTANLIADRMCIGWNAILMKSDIHFVYFQKILDDEVLLEPVIKANICAK